MTIDVFVCIRAEDVILEPSESGATSARNRLAGVIRALSPMGALVRVEIDCRICADGPRHALRI